MILKIVAKIIANEDQEVVQTGQKGKLNWSKNKKAKKNRLGMMPNTNQTNRHNILRETTKEYIKMVTGLRI